MNNTQEFDGEVLTNRCSLMGNKKVQEEENCQITGQKRQKSHLCMGLKDQEMIQSHISFNYNQLWFKDIPRTQAHTRKRPAGLWLQQ